MFRLHVISFNHSYEEASVYMSLVACNEVTGNLRRDETAIGQFVAGWGEERRTAAQTLYGECVDARPHIIDTLAFAPVDSEQETPQTLEHALEQYAQQSMAPARWELMLFFNRLSDSLGLRERELLRVVAEFTGDIAVQAVCKQYDTPVTMGQIRSDAMDLTMLHTGQPILALSQDIDAKGIDKMYVEGLTDAALAHPDVMFYTCDLRWAQTHPESLPDKIMAYWQELQELVTLPTARITMADSNAMIRIDDYAGVAQFDVDVDVRKQSETADLRRRACRILGRDAVGYVPGIVRWENPRRPYAAIAAGRSPVNMTVTGNFATFRDEVRAHDLDPRQVRLTPHQVAKLLAEIEAAYGERLAINGITSDQLDAIRAAYGFPATGFSQPGRLHANA